MKRLIAFVMLFLASHVNATEPFDFKGVPLGAGEKVYIEKIRTDKNKKFKCIDTSPERKPLGDRECHADTYALFEYAGTLAGRDSAFFIKDRLMYIEFVLSSFDIDGVIAALIQKYGKPQVSKKETYSNNYGTKFQGDLLEWKRGGSTIRLSQYSGNQ